MRTRTLILTLGFHIVRLPFWTVSMWDIKHGKYVYTPCQASEVLTFEAEEWIENQQADRRRNGKWFGAVRAHYLDLKHYLAEQLKLSCIRQPGFMSWAHQLKIRLGIKYLI